MIQEDYITFETAKLIKEKGFEQHFYDYYYTPEGDRIPWTEDIIYYPEDIFSCPSLSIVLKWLREKHKIHIDVGLNPGGKTFPEWTYRIDFLKSDTKNVNGIWYIDHVHAEDDENDEEQSWKEYGECMEDAIVYCLTKLI